MLPRGGRPSGDSLRRLEHVTGKFSRWGSLRLGPYFYVLPKTNQPNEGVELPCATCSAIPLVQPLFFASVGFCIEHLRTDGRGKQNWEEERAFVAQCSSCGAEAKRNGLLAVLGLGVF